MKISLILLALASLFLVSTTAVNAGISRNRVSEPLQPFLGCSYPECDPAVPATDLSTADGGIHAKLRGSVTYSRNPDGSWDVDLEMRNAAPGYTYAVKYYPLPLEIVTASKTGSASWQFHITADQISGMYWNLCVYSHTAYGGTNLTLLFFAVNWIYYYQP